jgi:murein DD-endopeptidase MepM/ murein hydrolase activator NlpD
VSSCLRRCQRRCRPLAPLVGCAVVLAMVITIAGPAHAQFIPPVEGVVVDGYRRPAHVGAAGNRGWEYRTAPGSEVRAVAAGTVVFAGAIGDQRYVSIDHVGGIRTSYAFVATILVQRGDVVAAGAVIATTQARFHFGVRRGGRYLDPGLLFTAAPVGPPRLIVRPGRVTRPPAPMTVRVAF